MPLDTIVVVTAVASAFLTFAVTVFWAERRTRRA